MPQPISNKQSKTKKRQVPRPPPIIETEQLDEDGLDPMRETLDVNEVIPMSQLVYPPKAGRKTLPDVGEGGGVEEEGDDDGEDGSGKEDEGGDQTVSARP